MPWIPSHWGASAGHRHFKRHSSVGSTPTHRRHLGHRVILAIKTIEANGSGHGTVRRRSFARGRNSLPSAIMRTNHTLAAIALAITLAACAVSAPPYHPSLRSVETLRRNAGPVAVGEFSEGQAATAQGSSLRLSEFRSSVGADFAAYLRDAVTQELALAGRLVENSNVVLSATLLEQSVSASPTARSSGRITAEFTIARSGDTMFRRTYSVTTSWDSSFFGSHAVGKAQTQYLFLVQALIRSATDDPEFLQALKPT